jgi:hypothetical protein
MSDDQSGNNGKGEAGGITGLIFLALAGLARSCDDIGRVAVGQVDNVALYADDVGRLSTQADDAARLSGQQIDDLVNLQRETAVAGEEASAASSLAQESSTAVSDDFVQALEGLGKAVAEETLKSDNVPDYDGDPRQ